MGKRKNLPLHCPRCLKHKNIFCKFFGLVAMEKTEVKDGIFDLLPVMGGVPYAITEWKLNLVLLVLSSLS